MRLGTLADSSLIARRIAPVAARLVASPAYLARAGVPRTPADLAGHESVPHNDQVWVFVRDGRRETFRPRGRFTSDSGQAELAAVVAGLGVAVMPEFLVGPAVGRGELVDAARRLRDPAGGDLRGAAAAGGAGADEGTGARRPDGRDLRRLEPLRRTRRESAASPRAISRPGPAAGR